MPFPKGGGEDGAKRERAGEHVPPFPKGAVRTARSANERGISIAASNCEMQAGGVERVLPPRPEGRETGALGNACRETIQSR